MKWKNYEYNNNNSRECESLERRWDKLIGRRKNVEKDLYEREKQE